MFAGVKSAWSGDYHLNINLQQAYWPANLVGAGSTMQPLLEFVETLARTGKFAARELYGITRGNSWVAHGFTGIVRSLCMCISKYLSLSLIRLCVFLLPTYLLTYLLRLWER